MDIGFLTKKDGFNRGEVCDVYPLIKWKKQFRSEGIRISFFRSHLNKKLFDNEIICIDNRYCWSHKKYDEKFIINLIKKAKKNDNKVAFFDNSDGPGSEHWNIINYADIFVKKQLYDNRKLYPIDRGYKNLNIFSSNFGLSDEQIKKNKKKGKELNPCPSDQTHKIRLGWNIGMYDYREFPFSKYYPFGTRRLFNSIYKLPSFTSDFTDKNIDSSFRGDVAKGDENYSWQRNQVIKYFKNEKSLKLKTGDIIPKRKYLKELRRSKTCVSPFGKGEICYRDFEAIISGCVLIKPDMDHIETFPDIYIKDRTYVDVRWDLKDLESKLNEVIDNYDHYKNYVYEAQKIYKKAISDSSSFIKHFKSIFE